jgi:hypothetical protein
MSIFEWLSIIGVIVAFSVRMEHRITVIETWMRDEKGKVK